MRFDLHPIPPGLWCVPSALAALTGKDPVSVIQPAINRRQQRRGSPELLGTVAGAYVDTAIGALDELGYHARRYRADGKRAQVRTWARRASDRYPGRALLLFTADHALVAQDGRIYDNWQPHGPAGAEHPYASTVVTNAYLVQRKIS